MRSLFELFKNHLSSRTDSSAPIPATENRSKGEVFDAETDQCSLVFPSSPRILYVCNRDLQVAYSYAQLEGIKLSKREDTIRKQTFEKIKKRNPQAFDGDQLIATDIIYEQSNNTLYFVVKRIKYSLLTALRQRAFGADSQLNHMNFASLGVILSGISTDDATVCMERSQLGLYSQVAGFTGPIELEGGVYLNFPGTNLPTVTANTEMHEELLGEGEPTPEQQFGFDTSGRRFDWSNPEMVALSMRRTRERVGWTAEFIGVTDINCTAQAIQKVLLNNRAKDAKEHTGESKVVSLKPADRHTVTKWLADEAAPIGKPLYLPTIFAAAYSRYGAPFPGRMPGTSCCSVALNSLFSRPRKPLLLPSEQGAHRSDSPRPS